MTTEEPNRVRSVYFHVNPALSSLLTRNPGNGLFMLTIGVQQESNLSGPFLAFPLNGPGTSTSFDAQGRLQFQFPGSNNAAYFQLLSQ
jgi:hypothetical protein